MYLLGLGLGSDTVIVVSIDITGGPVSSAAEGRRERRREAAEEVLECRLTAN